MKGLDFYMIDDALSKRLEFLRVTQETRACLTDLFPIVEKHLSKILVNFYTHLEKDPHLIAFFGSDRAIQQRTIKHAADAQSAHWRRLFSGQFDTNYINSVQRIGLTHSRIGLDPQWYMAGYAFVLNEIYPLIIQTYYSRLSKSAATQKIVKTLQALNQAVMLDMDLAISIYIQENERTYNDKISILAGDFEQSIKQVADILVDSSYDLEKSASNLSDVAAGARELTSNKATEVNTFTRDTASNIQAVADATEHLKLSSDTIIQQMASSLLMAQQAAQEAHRTESIANSLSNAVQKIEDVAQLIQHIAGQTNLLALNATIEAARAGEMGKGFAVVASEVKQLANQTATATGEITSQITSIQKASAETISAIMHITGIIDQMRQASTAIEETIRTQGDAIQEIADNAQQAADGTEQISANIKNVAQAINDTNTIAEQISEESQTLSAESSGLQNKVHAFLKTLREA